MAESEKAAAVLRAAAETLGSHRIPVSVEIMNRALERFGASFREDNGVYTVQKSGKVPSPLEGGNEFVVASVFEATGPTDKPNIRSQLKLNWVLKLLTENGYRAPFGPDASDEAAAIAALVFKGEHSLTLSEALVVMPIPPWVQGGEDWIHDMGRFPPETTLMTLSEARDKFSEWRLSIEAELASL